MPEPIDLFGARILVVDDQESNVRLLEYALRRSGYLAVSSTTDPLAVSALHRENRYDLILLDLQMPKMDGFEVMEKLSKEARVPILILSADPAKRLPALEAGAGGFLSKPFLLADVLLLVQVMLEKALSLDIEKPDGACPADRRSGSGRDGRREDDARPTP